ncbi:glycoside hydrolase family 76 protein [Rhodococcus sp. TAF43]|uniref:glycoside hydrolase family 76 protein n=1 Tax=unclassified Rhodococcus (in: high G+C Gram-positive bacteria) TaxID=192944 RepID=UPI0015833637|nr:glycoside hydrolase family 76 protein [Rhodococcus sp. W8901]QKT13143.1 fructose-bisphosphate aldolase [Rhodococcus sp. W8901]
MQREWSARADAAENAVITRHIRRVWGIPGTALAVVAWPAVRRERVFVHWHYWWQAHLINCTVDAAERNPTTRRRRRLTRLIRGHRIRNFSGWTNSYYDDMAWLGLALERAQRMQLIDNRKALATLESQLFDAWSPDEGGGIPWRKHSDFFNTPANGPAGLMLARSGRLWRAQAMADWIDDTLRDPETGLIFDGIRSDGTIERNIYSYCQGTVLSLETELAVRMGSPRHRLRVHRLVDAIDERLTKGGVIRGGGGGDGGLFNGLLARYLALVALMLPGDAPEDLRARRIAAQLVLGSAEAAWENRLQVEELPLFGKDWSQPALLPGLGAGIATVSAGSVHSSDIAERDFSVQLSGWLLMESAYLVSAAGYPKRR